MGAQSSRPCSSNEPPVPFVGTNWYCRPQPGHIGDDGQGHMSMIVNRFGGLRTHMRRAEATNTQQLPSEVRLRQTVSSSSSSSTDDGSNLQLMSAQLQCKTIKGLITP